MYSSCSSISYSCGGGFWLLSSKRQMGYIHPTQSSKPACSISLGATFSAEKMSPRDGLKNSIRSGRPEKKLWGSKKMPEPVESKEESKEEPWGQSGNREQKKAAGCRVQSAGHHNEDLLFCPKLRWNLRNMDFEPVKCLQQLQACSM